ncbi:MAG TPA: hypothetical protein EYQ31_14250 [Candidatus Handelsmanbacteria bacterium]|nr:hypothetical protein [Candidatus Handelsmanbacteria bacterium]
MPSAWIWSNCPCALIASSPPCQPRIRPPSPPAESVPTVWVPAPWRDKLTGGAAQVEVSGETVRQVIEALEAEYPGFRQRIIDAEQDRVRADIAVSVDGDISAEGLRRKVSAASEVHFLPAMSGG